MFDPKPKFFLLLAVIALGLVAVLYGLVERARIGNAPEALAPILFGGLAMLVAYPFAIQFGRGVYGQARLRAGHDLVARWWVSAADWDRFRAFDDAREPFARNAVHFRPQTRPDGIEIVVGTRDLMVDGSWHIIHGKIASEVPCGVCWFEVAPCCLEIASATSSGDAGLAVVRLPVPEAARAEGRRVFDHFNAQVPAERREWAERTLGYDFGARMPKGFEAECEVPTATRFANRLNRKRRDAGFFVAFVGAALAAIAWYSQSDGLMPQLWAGSIAIASLAIAILAAGYTLIFTRSPKG